MQIRICRDEEMIKKELKVPFSAPLNDRDTEMQTYGCRANNPDICANNSLQGICAFTSEDAICKKPSRAWKKQFNLLKVGELNEIKDNAAHVVA